MFKTLNYIEQVKKKKRKMKILKRENINMY